MPTKRTLKKVERNFSLLNNKKKDAVASFFVCEKLSFFDSANRALRCASTAIYAEISRNFKFAVTFTDSFARANALATAASNTFVTDFVSHGRILLF